jgi:Mandelate racemase / muconate lactonizing enzyme, N-terminal domain
VKVIQIETFQVAPRRLFVKADTDEGVTGWGEASLEGHGDVVRQAVAAQADYLIGRDPGRIEDHWQTMARGGFYRGGRPRSSGPRPGCGHRLPRPQLRSGRPPPAPAARTLPSAVRRGTGPARQQPRGPGATGRRLQHADRHRRTAVLPLGRPPRPASRGRGGAAGSAARPRHLRGAADRRPGRDLRRGSGRAPPAGPAGPGGLPAGRLRHLQPADPGAVPGHPLQRAGERPARLPAGHLGVRLPRRPYPPRERSRPGCPHHPRPRRHRRRCLSCTVPARPAHRAVPERPPPARIDGHLLPGGLRRLRYVAGRRRHRPGLSAGGPAPVRSDAHAIGQLCVGCMESFTGSRAPPGFAWGTSRPGPP